MRERSKVEYRAGDQIHIVITKDFAPIATEFFNFCRENHYNASEVIRSLIARWLEEQKEFKKAYEIMKRSRGAVKSAAREYEKAIIYEGR
ncbi:MAG: hypothetical protein DRN20_05915 [Thermoplasmata archaeon]|nr:MAG: hypothetical protein DRN20_05915 [Thermoplasmata archaeon]